jgi:hypothetical protein
MFSTHTDVSIDPADEAVPPPCPISRATVNKLTGPPASSVCSLDAQ